MDNIIAQESYRFLLSDSIWIGDRKFEKVINEEGQLLFTNNYSWVHDESKWVNSNNIFMGIMSMESMIIKVIILGILPLPLG